MSKSPGRRYVPLDKQCWFVTCKNEAVEQVVIQGQFRVVCKKHAKGYKHA